MQNYIATGHLGGDVEMRYLPTGDAVANFSLAVSRRWTGKDGQTQEKTVWIRVTVWRKLAENCAKFIEKGSKVLIVGELEPINIFEKKDGTAGANYEVTAQTVEFLDSKPQDGEPPAHRQQAQATKPQLREEDIPF